MLRSTAVHNRRLLYRHREVSDASLVADFRFLLHRHPTIEQQGIRATIERRRAEKNVTPFISASNYVLLSDLYTVVVVVAYFV